MSLADEYISRRGVIHVHSNYDDGQGEMAAIYKVAEEEGLDYLVITDHHEPHAVRDGWHGRQAEKPLLVVVGTEHATLANDHMITLGLHVPAATRRMPSARALQLLKDLNANTFIAHPEGRDRVYLPGRCNEWQQWDNSDYTGVEIWNYMHDWIKDMHLWNLPRRCRNPEEYITGPEEHVLAAWDKEAQKRKVAGICGLDVHARLLPFGLHRYFSWASEGILPYRHTFGALNQYVLLPKNWGHEPQRDTVDLIEALSEGRGWLCRESLAPGGEFSYFLEYAAREFPSGSSLNFDSNMTLKVNCDREAELRLLCRGEVVASEEASQSLTFVPEEAGEYRVEVRLDGKPWIYSNHIYLRNPRYRRPGEMAAG